jgi:hypothetical protein
LRTCPLVSNAEVCRELEQGALRQLVIDQLSDWGTGFAADFGFNSVNPFTPRSGTWTVQNNSYMNTSNQAAAISTAGFPPAAGDFTLYANLSGKWSNSGNRGGLVWDYRDANNYSGILISVGTASHAGSTEVFEVVAGTRRVLASLARGLLGQRTGQSNRRSIADHRARRVGAVYKFDTAGPRR